MAKSKQTRAKAKAKAKQGEGRQSTKAQMGQPQMATEASSSAVELLKQDHRKVEQLFEEFEQADDADRQQQLAEQVCRELMVHSLLEEEIFYPACRTAG